MERQPEYCKIKQSKLLKEFSQNPSLDLLQSMMLRSNTSNVDVVKLDGNWVLIK